MPALAMISASPSFWQVMPFAPAAICIFAIVGFLCVLMCGRLATRRVVAGLLDPCDVALDPVHVDDGAGSAIFTGDLGGEGSGHGIL